MSCSRAAAALTILACSSAPAARDPAAPGALPAAAGGCVWDARPFSLEALRAEVSFLAAPERAGRAPGSAGDAATRAHLAERFRCLGLRPAGRDGSFEQPFVDGRGRATANVVGYLPGVDPRVGSEVVLVGAHHDHLGDPGGRVYPGADDNASGVAALLAIAQALRQRAQPPRRTVAFVAFAAEEVEGAPEGSSHYVEHAPAALPMHQVVYLINLDMVGAYSGKQVVHALGSYPGTPARALLQQRRGHPDLHVALGGRGCCSDHQRFCEAGVPYVFFWTPDPACYHRRCDTPDRVDYPHLSAITEVATELVAGLADSELALMASRQKRGCGRP